MVQDLPKIQDGADVSEHEAHCRRRRLLAVRRLGHAWRVAVPGPGQIGYVPAADANGIDGQQAESIVRPRSVATRRALVVRDGLAAGPCG